MVRNGKFALLLAALVVLCPYQCIFSGRCTNGSTTESVGCHCCGSQDQANDRETIPQFPVRPESCPCEDCFCRGALIEQPTDVGVATFSRSVTEFPGFDLVFPDFSVALGSAQIESCSFLMPYISSGHNVRAALSCWLN
jgi:hypothetical protein